MQITSFKYIEDYLEILGGQRDCLGNPVTGLFFPRVSEVRLARYDVSVVDNLSQQTTQGQPLTDRQGQLVHKIISKYRKQFLNLGVEVGDHLTNPKFRKPLKIVERIQKISIVNNRIVISFPYNKNLIDQLAEHRNISHGLVKFDRDEKVWQMDLTEYNVSWSRAFAEQHGFDCDSEFLKYWQLLEQCEKTPFAIELKQCESNLIIDNAEPSLVDYINNNLGGFSKQNTLTLVDNFNLLGFTIEKDLKDSIADTYGISICDLITSKHIHAARTSENYDGEDLIDCLVRYAELVNRWPIYVYDPMADSGLRANINNKFDQDQILDLVNKKSSKIDLENKKCVYLNKLKRSWPKAIPLMLSTNAMIHGLERQHMMLMSEKIVYFTQTVYDNGMTKIAS
jgi:hypothetical protein